MPVNGTISAPKGEWRNWQTRRIQVPVIARSWGFKSPLAHEVILDPTRPRRRAARVIWPVVITAAAVLALVVAGAGRDTRVELEYLDSLHAQASDLAIGAESLADVSARLFSVGRVEFVEVTDSLRVDLATGLDLARADPPSDSLVAVNALYTQTLEAWNRGVSGFASGVLVAADDPDNKVVADNIADALAELRAGDELYRQMVAELDREEVPSPMAPMPEVIMMPAEGSLATLSRTYVEAARAPSSGLALRAGLGISQLVSDPSWLVDPDGQAVLPATEQVTFSVVITNSGNVISFPETLRLTLTGGPEIVVLTTDVEPLDPGRLRAIQFEPVDVETGLVYEVSAVLEVTNTDTNLGDNEISVVFVVNEGETSG